jgi:ribosomal protein L24
MNYGYYDTWNEYFIEFINKIKKKWLKKDKEQLKQLELQSKKLDIERDIAYSNFRKIADKCEKVENKIYKLNQKYTYRKKIKVRNPHYKEKEVLAI